MRDIKRIELLMTKLTEFWKQFPDLRFTQLMEVITTRAIKQYGKDPFYLEDDELSDLIDQINTEKELE